MSLNPRLRAKLERQSEQERRMTREQRESLAALLPEGRVLFDEAVSRHSASGAGGQAEAFLTADGTDELKAVMAWAVENGVEYRFFGRGSSTLVRDKGAGGLLIRLGSDFEGSDLERRQGEEVFVSAGAAAGARALCEMCAAKGFAGIDRMSDFHGTVGGALFAKRGEAEAGFTGAVEEITIVTKEGRELTLRGAALRFEAGALRVPRTSAVTRVLFKLRAAGAPAEVSASAPEDRRISFVFRSGGKTKASVLIDEAGLCGVRVGGARVAGDDPNAIVNEGGATAKDIAVLMSLVRDRVREFTGVTLDPAIEIIGER